MNLASATSLLPFVDCDVPTYDQLVDFVSRAGMKRLRTGTRGSFFEIRAEPTRLMFRPESSGNARSGTSREQVERLLQRFARIGSRRPSHYIDLTPNASYVLALLREFEEATIPV